MAVDTASPLFRDALHWAELGMVCFIAAAIATVIILLPTSGWASLDPLSLAIRSTFTVAPFLLTWATYEKLVKPLKEDYLPRDIRKWSVFLTLVGILGCVVGIYVLGHADEKIKNLLRTEH